MNIRKTIGFVLLLCAYGLLIPGLTQPMLSVSGTVEKSKLVSIGQDMFRNSKDIPGLFKDLVDPLIDSVEMSGTVPAFSKTNSILGTANELYSNNHVPVAVLILLFSVGIPLIKALLLIAAHLPLRDILKQRFLWLSAVTSKWSMVDVFVVAIFVAYLAANGFRESRGLVDFESELGAGFYYFLGYCLVSIVANQLLAGTISWQRTGEQVGSNVSKEVGENETKV